MLTYWGVEVHRRLDRLAVRWLSIGQPVMSSVSTHRERGASRRSRYQNKAHQYVQRPTTFSEQHQLLFQRWADKVGLLLEPAFLPFLQLAPIPLTRPSLLQGAVKALSVVRRGGGDVYPPPPLHELHSLGVWHSVFFSE